MSNMSHCRFHNTRQDLQECLSAMADGDELSPAEAKERDRLLLICAEIAEDWEGEIEELGNNILHAGNLLFQLRRDRAFRGYICCYSPI